MRIITGTLKGRKLKTPADASIRPTSDRVREAVFNIIGHKVSGAHVLDLFAGTGALGIEALSRGSTRAVFVDLAPQSLSIVRKNLELFNLLDRTEILSLDLAAGTLPFGISRNRFDLVFLDPPYGKGLAETVIKADGFTGCLNREALVIIEHSCREKPPEAISGLDITDQRKYGKTCISFFTLR